MQEECIVWTRGLNTDGYGQMGPSPFSTTRRAHRRVWEECFGPIPSGLELDHLCRNRACINPAHLELVTHAENCRRGVSASALNAQKAECLNGHPFDDANTWRDKYGRRHCRTCHRDKERARYQARKAAKYA